MSTAALHATPPPAQPYHVAALQSPSNASPISSRQARSLSASASNAQSPSAKSKGKQPVSQQSPQQDTLQQSSAQASSSAMTSPVNTDTQDHGVSNLQYAPTYRNPQMEASSSHHATTTHQQPTQQDVSASDSPAEIESYQGSPVQPRGRDWAPPNSPQVLAGGSQGSQQSPSGRPAQSSFAEPQEDTERDQAPMEIQQEEMPQPVAHDLAENARAAPRSRQEHLRTGQGRRESRFRDYILGQTLGEGEFGKVKMGWKEDGGAQVAIKLIKREILGQNANRLPKIYREISILSELRHPNIVRLHEVAETDRLIGIVLEYASGGELFDYILNHRYLNDRAARKLFAQLISGVGYCHNKGIVHRDLKLENLLLDRNKNMIITDFGFANTFDPTDDISDIEGRLADRDFVRNHGLDLISPDGRRRGDLMQTSCGSPCYAAPELVVSETLYTARKVDVWSCGVILYAMLAGYLPYDDDPANPEGDNITQLYRYIVQTPLTFPEYVTPHARDLLRRMLVPDPRQRADLFEVARHSWLADYAPLLTHITTGATTVPDVAGAEVLPQDPFAGPQLGRSHSVREPSRTTQPLATDSLTRHATRIDATNRPAQQRDDRHKRATLQVEYVEPISNTTRGEASTALPPLQAMAPPVAGPSRSRARADIAQGPVAIASSSHHSPTGTRQQRPVTQGTMEPPARPGREPPRAVSDSTALNMHPPPPSRDGRPGTSGTMDRVGGSRLPSRGNSYGQAIAPTVAATNAEGRFSQPKNSGYYMSGSMPEGSSKRNSYAGRPMSQHIMPSDLQRQNSESEKTSRGHRRTSTVESFTSKIFGRTASRRQSSGRDEFVQPERPSRAYPPVSMRNSMLNDSGRPRTSVDPGRPSFGGESRKNSEVQGQQQKEQNRQSRRFSSFLPQSFSRMSFSSTPRTEAYEGGDNRRESMGPPPSSRHGVKASQGLDRSSSQNTAGSNIPALYDNGDQRGQMQRRMPQNTPVRGATAPNLLNMGQESGQQQIYEPSAPLSQGNSREAQRVGTAGADEQTDTRATARQHAVLQKPRKFGEAYETTGASSSSSGGARRVMDWFRKRGKDRSG